MVFAKLRMPPIQRVPRRPYRCFSDQVPTSHHRFTQISWIGIWLPPKAPARVLAAGRCPLQFFYDTSLPRLILMPTLSSTATSTSRSKLRVLTADLFRHLSSSHSHFQSIIRLNWGLIFHFPENVSTPPGSQQTTPARPSSQQQSFYNFKRQASKVPKVAFRSPLWSLSELSFRQCKDEQVLLSTFYFLLP